MARPRTPIGTFGDISFINATSGQFRARTRFRDDDGKVRRVSATGLTKREAERNLKKVLAERSSFRSTGELTAGRLERTTSRPATGSLRDDLGSPSVFPSAAS
jgi:hypothetical protein